MLNLESFINIK